MNAGADALDEAAEVLDAGGMCVIPTDTVYGVAVRSDVDRAAHRLAEAKGRPADQAVAVLVGSLAQAQALGRFDPDAGVLAAELWPGPLTLVLPRVDPGVRDLGGDPSTIGVRWPDHDVVMELARRIGPLAVTSANRHGERTPTTALAAAGALVEPVDLAVDGGPCSGRPSTVVDLTGGVVDLLRVGSIPRRRIRRLISDG